MHILERLLEIIASYPRQTIVGVGDLMLDQYRRGKAVGLSPEAPAIELLNPGLTETPGGAANVARNIGSLKGNVRIVGVVGADREGRVLRELLAHAPGVSLLAVEDTSRPTTVKLRFYHDQFQVLRVSNESHAALEPEVAGRLCQALEREAATAPVLFIEDYGKQVINPDVVDTLLRIRRSRPNLPIILDPKVGNHHVYRTGMCTHLKPNWKEACQLTGASPENADPATVARTLGEMYGCDVLMTRGREGIHVFERSGLREQLIPSRPREAFDIAGAGDTALAVIALSLAAGASLPEAALLANAAGGIVVEKSGTAFVTPEELLTDLAHPKTKELLVALEEAIKVAAPTEAAQSAR